MVLSRWRVLSRSSRRTVATSSCTMWWTWTMVAYCCIPEEKRGGPRQWTQSRYQHNGMQFAGKMTLRQSSRLLLDLLLKSIGQEAWLAWMSLTESGKREKERRLWRLGRWGSIAWELKLREQRSKKQLVRSLDQLHSLECSLSSAGSAVQLVDITGSDDDELPGC